MSGESLEHPVVHFVGSIPLPDAETVFRTLAAATGTHVKRLPDGESQQQAMLGKPQYVLSKLDQTHSSTLADDLRERKLLTRARHQRIIPATQSHPPGVTARSAYGSRRRLRAP
jgi:hypothetical protein